MRLTVVLLYCAKLSAVCKPHVDLIGYGGLKKRENFLQQAAVYGVVGRFTGGNGSVARFHVFRPVCIGNVDVVPLEVDVGVFVVGRNICALFAAPEAPI